MTYVLNCCRLSTWPGQSPSVRRKITVTHFGAVHHGFRASYIQADSEPGSFGPNSSMLQCSSGNHGAALAHAAQATGTKATIIMPSNAPTCKVNAAMGAGGKVVLCEPTIEARTAAAQAHMDANPSCTLIPPYNHPHIVAGQGTVALELLQQVSGGEALHVGAPGTVPEAPGPDDANADVERAGEAAADGQITAPLDAVIVPVSGGGLISGIATVIKSALPNCKVLPLGCCSQAACTLH